MGKLHLVLGATGGLGSAIVRRLEGEELRVLVRDPLAFARTYPESGAEVVKGDLSRQEDIDRAIDGAGVVFHAACPTSYFNWGDLIGHTRRLVKSAEEEVERVDIVFPSNVWVYGRPDYPDNVKEDQPHAPVATKGTIQQNVERCIREANARGECRTTIARFPDLYGPRVVTRMADRVFKRAAQGSPVSWPGRLDAPRQLVYVDDAAEAMVRLSQSDRPWGEAWHVAGPGRVTPKELIETAFEEAGREPRIGESGQLGHWLDGVVSTEAKLERELFYLFDAPVLLDATKFSRAFKWTPSTPYREGAKRTVEWWRAVLTKIT